jgi:hypothetical protein
MMSNDEKLVGYESVTGRTNMITRLGDQTKEKQMIFITMIGATDEQLEDFSKVLQSIPEVANNYTAMITSVPTQYMNPHELIESMSRIHNVSEDGDPHDVGLTRTDRFRRSLRYTGQFMERSISFMETMEASINTLSETIDLLSAQCTPGVTHQLMMPNHDLNSIKNAFNQMKNVLPNEAEYM